jgi:signal transduction histidine kinase
MADEGSGVEDGDGERAPGALRAVRPLAVVAGLAALVLTVQLPPIYARLLQLGVLAVAVFIAVTLFRVRRRAFAVGAIVVAVVYLPIFVWPGLLWTILSVAAAVYLFVLAVLFKGPPPEPDPDNLPQRFF